MDMGMESELLIPGVQHGEEADFRAEVPRIRRATSSRVSELARSSKTVDDFLILQG